MSTTELQSPIVDWAPFILDADGNLATQAVVNTYIPFDTVTDAASFQAMVDQVEAEARSILTPDAFGVLQGLNAYMQDLAAEQLVPYGEESAFWLALEYSYGQPDFPTGGNVAAWLTPYVQRWAVARGANPGPTYVAPPPPTLTTPSQGQTVVAKGAREVVPSQVPSADLSPASVAAIQTAIGVASADILKVQAAVMDAMLPNLAPGQVPQALDQLNTAATVLERQMAGVMTSLNRDITGSLAAQLNGALETLNGLAQEVGILAQDVAMKAESTIGDDVNANTAEIGVLSGAVATIVGTAIPDLAQGLQGLTSTVGSLDNTVTNEIEPQLAQTTEQTAANTDTLSGTDKDCLDQLCDAEGNVINPITEGGATPSLLKNLGGLLTKAFEIGALMSLVEGLVTLANTKIAVNAIISDTETITGWAVKAAGVIETDFDLSGWG
jgi:uncharacterized protein YoxC